MSVLGQSLNLLSSILTILLTCPNSDALVCYSNDPFLTVQSPMIFLGVETLALRQKLVHFFNSQASIHFSVSV